MFSKKRPGLFLLIVMFFALTALVSCTSSPSEETPCDNVEGTCIFVTFDGTNCEVVGPTDNLTGEFIAIFANQSEGPTHVEVARIIDEKTIQDLEEDTRERPTYGAPPWINRMGFWGQIVDPGETVTHTSPTATQGGDYGVICFRIPQYAVFGGGFTLVE